MQLLQRLLNSRQLALKLVANTTFGYTAASYSGRMPCIEIADSIVEKGRETLERAIQLVNSTPKWKGRVVYGDTDSLFVLLKGVSKDEAFQIGKDICARVAEENPKPVKLKFEKVSERERERERERETLYLLLRCIFPAFLSPRRDMLGTATSLQTNRSQSLMPKGSRL